MKKYRIVHRRNFWGGRTIEVVQKRFLIIFWREIGRFLSFEEAKEFLEDYRNDVYF